MPTGAASPLALIVVFAAAALLCFALVPPAVKFAWSIGYLDHPEARKLHTKATALLGGATVFISALIVWGVAMLLLPHARADWEAYYLVFGAALTLGLGLWDDRFGMQPGIKMLGQAAAAAMLVASGLAPELGLPLGIEAAITLVALVALMN